MDRGDPSAADGPEVRGGDHGDRAGAHQALAYKTWQDGMTKGPAGVRKVFAGTSK
jgi:hypothetical protein